MDRESRTELQADKFLKAVENVVAEKTKEAEFKMFEALYQLELYIPDYPEDEQKGAGIFTLTSGEGKQFIPAFLKEDVNLGRFAGFELKTVKYTELKYYVIDSMGSLTGIVLNPFDENIILDKNFIEMADLAIVGMSLSAAEHEGKVIITTPTNLSDEMVDELNSLFEKRIDVENVWVFDSREESESKPHITVLVEFAGNKIDLFPKLAEIVKKYLKNGDSFELIQKYEDFDVSGLEEVKIFRGRSSKYIN